jgi:hypothetical protein
MARRSFVEIVAQALRGLIVPDAEVRTAHACSPSNAGARLTSVPDLRFGRPGVSEGGRHTPAFACDAEVSVGVSLVQPTRPGRVRRSVRGPFGLEVPHPVALAVDELPDTVAWVDDERLGQRHGAG